MSYQNKQRIRIEDLPDDGNELFDLSEEKMLIGIVGGGGSCSGSVHCHAREIDGQCVDVNHPDDN